MITLITGLPGSGKSLFTLKTVKDLADKENRPVFYHGIPELTLDWQLMEKGEDWVNCPKGAIIVIDECQGTFRPRQNGSQVPKHVSQLEVHRHDGHDLFLITQHPMLIDGNLRRLVGRHYHVERFYGFAKSTIHEFQSVRENVKSLKGSIEKHFVYPKEVFTWYKSADLHTMKKRIPARLVLVVVLPILLIAAIWYALVTIGSFSDKHQIQPEKTQDGLMNVQPVNQIPVQPTNPKPDWYAQQVERVPGLPHTRPVYDEITKPVTAPINAACVDFRGQCKCYTQQATELNTDELMCRQIIAKGFFVDFNPGQSIAEVQRRQEVADRQAAERQRIADDHQRASERQEAEREKQQQAPVQTAQQPEISQQPIQPSAIQRERMKESQWAFPNT
ncbi:Zonular occludens toxin [Methylobacillus caricis]|uniref:zonular occludens toxin domain-containing protein n=1 Tax=Methylobacillus caricis TaxID=1971611 RepID=UPI001D0017BA|nr:zonular occludens toxin domain-containing protein [Methylobacillus caricis]MCB5187587.1 Zonular occludens toxin [Methylobacillus caricis]